jgi:hypothetical protein
MFEIHPVARSVTPLTKQFPSTSCSLGYAPTLLGESETVRYFKCRSILLVIGYLLQHGVPSSFIITLREYVFCHHIGVVSIYTPIVHSAFILTCVKEGIGIPFADRVSFVISRSFRDSCHRRLSIGIDHEFGVKLLVESFKLSIIGVGLRLL